MRAQKTIYIRPGDEAMWTRAVKAAKAERLSLSAFIASAVERALDRERETE